MIRFPVLAALLCLPVLPVAAAPGRAGAVEKYDGTWSVEILTEVGSCDRAYRYPVRIENGQARFIGTAFTVSGQVAPDGAIAGSVSAGLASANVVGRLGRNGTGRGTWTASGSVECRGRWNAERRS
jgi:hypothetical protein